MAATAIASEETCGSCCDKLKELIKTYEVELGLDENNDGTKGKQLGCRVIYLLLWMLWRNLSNDQSCCGYCESLNGNEFTIQS